MDYIKSMIDIVDFKHGDFSSYSLPPLLRSVPLLISNCSRRSCRQIKSIATSVAIVLFQQRTAAVNPDADIVEGPAAKRPKRPNKMSLLAQTLGRPTAPNASWCQSTHRKQLWTMRFDRYMKVEHSACTYHNVHEWRGHSKQISDFPFVSQVASALFGMKPGSGGLECDIGSMDDVIGRCESETRFSRAWNG
jgi:hypothetical protein